ncbi:prephenate dehydrogenase [Myxococcota bacterium]|nr:prephenate dehydrogenase [Myxococcota bacterium]
MIVFERLAVVGLGLLGSSVALAAKRSGVARQVIGTTRNPEVLRETERLGIVDETRGFSDVAEGADLVVLATTIDAMPEVLRKVVPGLGGGALVTDVGSVKGPLVETLPGLLPPGVSYVGSHPMAGSHETSYRAARADLFEDSVCVVTDAQDAAAVARVDGFWEALGARVVRRSAARHDEEVAWVSHVPHVVAYAFAHAFSAAPSGARELAGPGFNDFTRIARSHAGLWSEILTVNRKAMAGSIEAVGSALLEFARAIEADDAAQVEDLIAAAHESLVADESSE